MLETRYTKAIENRPVQEAVTTILRGEEERARRRRAQAKPNWPPKPVDTTRSRIRPASVPLATGPTLAERIGERAAPAKVPLEQRIGPAVASFSSTPALPVGRRPIDFDFAKKTPSEIAAVLDKRISSTITRLLPIFELDLLKDTPPDDKRAVERLGLRLNWASSNVEQAFTWSKVEQDSLCWGLKTIGEINFSGLRRNRERIIKQLVHVHKGGYFDWIKE